MGKSMNSKVILVDSILNVGLLAACIKVNLYNALAEPGKIMVLMIYGCILGLFVVADLMYWVFRWQKKQGSIVNEIARYSVYIKGAAVVLMGLIAVGLHM